MNICMYGRIKLDNILITYYKYLKPIVNINSFTYLCISHKEDILILLQSD